MSGLVPGLQNQLERFDSASDLQQMQLISQKISWFFYSSPTPKTKTNYQRQRYRLNFLTSWKQQPRQASKMPNDAKHHASENRGSVDKCWGHWNKKHKKQPFSDASASHLSLVLWHVWFQTKAWISHTTSPTPPSYEVGGIAKRIKTARLRRKTNLQKSVYPKAQIKRYPNSFCPRRCDDLWQSQ